MQTTTVKPSRTQPAGTLRTQATAKAAQLETASASILTAARFALTSEQEHSLGGWSRTSRDESLGITEIVYQETRKMPIRRLLYVDGSNTGYTDEAAFEAAYRAANAAKQAEPRRTQQAGTRNVFALTADGFKAAARAKAAAKRAKAAATALTYGLIYNGGNPNCPTGYHLMTPSGVIVRVENGRTLRVDDGLPYEDQIILDGMNARLEAMGETFRVPNKHRAIRTALWLELDEIGGAL